MSTTQFLGSKFKSWKNGGIVNNAGTVEFFEIGGTFSVYVSSYSDSSLTTPNSNVVTLDSEGEADIWLGSTVDVRIRDSVGVTIDTFLNWNPTSIFTVAYTTDTTLTASSSGKLIRTTANIILPTASTLVSGWHAYIKNMHTASITIARNFSSDTIKGLTSNLTLYKNQSIWVIVNAELTGFDLILSPFSEIDSGSTDQLLSLSAAGPVWLTVNLKSAGDKLYRFYNFT